MTGEFMKKAASALLAALLLTGGLASCIRIEQIGGGDKPETEATPAGDPGGDPAVTPGGAETDAPGTDPAEIEVNFTLDDLYGQNVISNLLRWHDSVTVTREYDGGSEIQSFWMRDGSRVYIDESTETYDGETYRLTAGSYHGIDFQTEDGSFVEGVKWVTADGMSFDEWIDGQIIGYLPGELTEDIRILSEDGDRWTILMMEMLPMDEEVSVPCANTAVINKGTLDIYSYTWEYEYEDTTHTGAFTVEYDGKKNGEDLMAAWDNTRQVELSVKAEADGGRNEVFDYPASWQLQLLPDDGIYLSSADGIAEDGSVVLEPGSGSVSVLAYDEANVPAFDPEPLDGLPFTMDELRENNRITNLLNKYKTVMVPTSTEFGDYTQSFFRYGDKIVRWTESRFEDGDEVYETGYGNLDRDYFEIDFEGGYVYYGSVPDNLDYLFTDTNADGEHYDYDLTFTEAMLFGEMQDIQTVGDNVSFKYVYEFDETGEDASVYTVEPVNALIRSIDMPGSGVSMKILLGEDVPFEKTVADAFKKTRTIVCHFSEAGDATYTIPADWAFHVGYFDELTCYSDAAMKEACDDLIPGDGKDYEIWVKEEESDWNWGETDPIEYYVGEWISESGASSISISSSGLFELEYGGDLYTGALSWTEEDRGNWASGPRYELMLDDGSIALGDAYVTIDAGGFTLCAGGGAELYVPLCPVDVTHVDSVEGLLSSYNEYTAEKGDYAVTVVFSAEETVKDFSFVSLKMMDGTEEDPMFEETVLYSLAELKPDKPFVAHMSFGEFIPVYGFECRCADGIIRTFGVTESGMDGSVIVRQVRAPKG